MLPYEVILSEKCHIIICLSVKRYIAASIVMFPDTLRYYMVSVPVHPTATNGKRHSFVILF